LCAYQSNPPIFLKKVGAVALAKMLISNFLHPQTVNKRVQLLFGGDIDEIEE
jgi:hypothetical protein